MSAVLISSPLFSPLQTRLRPDLLSNCLMLIKIRQSQLDPPRSLSVVPSVDTETIVRVSASTHVPLGRLGNAYLLFPNSKRDHRTCRSFELVHATYVPIFKRTLHSRDPEIERLAIYYICPADRDLNYANRRDLILLPSVDSSPSLSPVDSGVVCHTAIVVDLDLAIRYSLDVTWLPTLIGGPNRGSEIMRCYREPDRVRC